MLVAAVRRREHNGKSVTAFQANKSVTADEKREHAADTPARDDLNGRQRTTTHGIERATCRECNVHHDKQSQIATRQIHDQLAPYKIVEC